MKTTKNEIVDNLVYFQFYGFPIYIRFALEAFDSGLSKLLLNMGFKELKPEAKQELLRKGMDQKYLRILTIQEASFRVGAQIKMTSESDRFGRESVVQKPGYRVYRLKGMAMMVLSLASKNWEVGVHNTFGHSQHHQDTKIVLHRYLSWALSAFGVIGFWGISVDEGIVVLKPQESNGEAVYIDVELGNLFSSSGERKIPADFKILRLDSKLTNRTTTMKLEELISFLQVSCTYFDVLGLSIPIRQALHSASKIASGVICPKGDFKVRSDLSL